MAFFFLSMQFNIMPLLYGRTLCIPSISLIVIDFWGICLNNETKGFWLPILGVSCKLHP